MQELGWGLQITVLGMGLVFSLLALMWGLLVLALKFDAPEAPAVPAAAAAIEDDAAQPAQALAAPEPADPLDDPALVAAIVIALRAHVSARRVQAAPQMRLYWPGSMMHASRWVVVGRSHQTRAWRRNR